MKISAIEILRYNRDTPDAIILTAAHNVAEYSMFQRGSVKEFLNFASKTLMKRLPAGVHAVEYEAYTCYCMITSEGLGAVALCDKEYPMRVAMTMLRDVLTSFKTEHPGDWRAVAADHSVRFPQLEAVLRDFQDPTKVDKIAKLDRSLGETKEVLRQTIEKVLERGEKLDELVEKSETLSASSKMFYRQAKKTNSCCVIM